MILRSPAYPFGEKTSVIALIKKEAGLLPLQRIHGKVDSAFHRKGRHSFPGNQGRFQRHSFEIRGAAIGAIINIRSFFEETLRDRLYRGHQKILTSCHPKRVGLQHPGALKAIDHKTGQAISFPKHSAVGGLGSALTTIQSFALQNRTSDGRLKKFLINFLPAFAGQKSHADERFGIYESGAKIFSAMIQHFHQRAGLILLKALGVAQFITENPGMQAPRPGIGVAIQSYAW